MEHITCDCSVLGTWQSGGLIVLHDGRPRAVGKSQVHHNNLYPTSTKLLEGELLRVVAHKVDLRGRTLRWLLERLDKRHTYAAAKIHRAAYPGCRPLGRPKR